MIKTPVLPRAIFTKAKIISLNHLFKTKSAKPTGILLIKSQLFWDSWLTAAEALASGEASRTAASSGSTSPSRVSARAQARIAGGEGRKAPLEAFGTASRAKKIAVIEFGQGNQFLELMTAFLAGEFVNRHWSTSGPLA
jgi:hypothetical protein